MDIPKELYECTFEDIDKKICSEESDSLFEFSIQMYSFYSLNFGTLWDETLDKVMISCYANLFLKYSENTFLIPEIQLNMQNEILLKKALEVFKSIIKVCWF